MLRISTITLILLSFSCPLILIGQTVFEPGDVAILGINANNQAVCGGSNGEDYISLVCFKDLTNGTTIDLTDNGWQRLYAGFWGTTEGVIRITRTGGTVPAGTVITFAINNNNVTGLSPDNNWSSVSLNGTFNYMNINSSGDQIFVMQGGNWSTAGTHLGSYDGTILFGFSTSGGWSTYTGLDLGTGNSTTYPGMVCLNMAPTSNSDWSKYTGDISPTTQRLWLDRVNELSNWSGFGNCGAYNIGTPVYQSGYSIGILPGGFEEGYWLGITSNDWFDCENWENLRVPEDDTGVLLRPLNGITGPFVHAQIAGLFAECRSLDIQTGGQLTIMPLGELTIFEDIRNNGSLNASGSVVLEGTTTSVLSGSNGIGLRTLTLNKSGGAAIFTDTVVTITANGDLFFINGIVTPLSADKVVFQTNAEANNATNASYVEGVVIKEGNEDFMFPVGDGFYQPIGLENIGTFNSVFEAEFIDANGPGVYNYNWEPSINNVATCSYWTLDRLNGTDAEVRLSWGNDSDCGITDPASLVVSRFDGSQWINHGQQGFSGNATAGSVLSLDVINNFSAFALASTSGFNPLPVEWLHFNAKVQSVNSVKLNWSTATEINNDYFAVEHATDGVQFNELETVNGAGNATSIQNYQYVHQLPQSGINYYRLRQTDFNGDFEYSPVRAVELFSAGNSSIALIDRLIRIQLPFSAQRTTVELYSAAGQLISTQPAGTGSDFAIDAAINARGVYIVRVRADNQVFTGRVVY